MDLYGFQFLGVLISVAEKIGELDAPELIELTNRLKSSLKKVRGISSKIFTMQFRDELGLLEYLNIYFMWDIAGFYSVLDKIENNIAALREIFQIVGHLDAMIAIASFRQAYPQNCRPQFPSNPDKFFVQDMLHPLLDAPVANSFDFAGRQFLISGANMAGKTTFLKAVGLNSVLAQTIYTCIATKFEAPLLRVISSVERQDNLLHGKSYYLAEVESVLRITRAADSQEQYLFLLDEIFRGTNSVERQAISYAVLRYLVNRKDFLLVATHDLNLCERLQDQYANFHFCEEVNSRGLAFDYKIQPGIARTRNAIALLRYVGYPDSIIEIAQKCVEKISAPEPGTHPIDGKNQQ